MAKRKTYRATVVTAAGEVIAQRDAYAWNSTVRASEALVRELAREQGTTYQASPPEYVIGESYRRMWAGGNGLTLCATIAAVTG